jgi:hypothetical protein
MRSIACAALLLATTTAHAGWLQRSSLDEAVSEARERYHGRVISAETLLDAHGRETYNIRILTPEGRVKRYRVRAGEERRRRHRNPRH